MEPAIKVKANGSNWQTSDMEDLWAGLMSPEDLRRLDPRGMTLGYAASVRAAILASRLMALLDEDQAAPGEDVLSRIEDLLEQLVRREDMVLERLDALISIVSPRMAKIVAERATAEETSLPPAKPPRQGKGRGANG